jgi:PAS domain S-box-containing protein
MGVGILQRESLLAEAFARSPVAKVVLTLAAGVPVEVAEANAAFCRLVAREHDELVGGSWTALCAEDLPGDGAISCVLSRPDGSRVRVSGSVVTVREDSGTAYAIAELIEGRDAETERLRTTISVQREITAVARDRDAVLKLIADRTLEVLPSGDTCVVQLLDQAEGALRSVAGSGRLAARRLPPTPVKGSLSGIAIDTGRTQRCDDTETDPRVNRAFSRSNDIRALIVAPLYDMDGTPLGALGLGSRHPNAFDDGDEQQLTLLAQALGGALRHAGDAAENAALLERTRAAVRALAKEQQATLSAVEQLVRSERRFASVFEHSPIAKIVVGLRAGDLGRIIHANPAFHDIFGHPAAQVGGLRLADLIVAEQAEELAQSLAGLAAGQDRGGEREVVLRRADGQPVTVCAYTSVIEEEGNPQTAVIQFLDVTAARAAQAAVTRSEEQFRTAFDGSPIAMLIGDERARIRQANPAAVALTGRSVEELDGLSANEIIDAERWRVAATEDFIEEPIRRPDGSTVWVRATLSVIPGLNDDQWRLVQAQDITAERLAADAIIRQVERLRATLDLQREVTAAAADRDATLRVIAERALDVFESAVASGVVLLEGEQLRCVAAAGTLAAAAGQVISATGTFTGLALTTGGTASCPDTSVDERVDGVACAQLGVASAITAALYAESRVIGSLTITSDRAYGFDDTDEQHLALLADSLSSALRHADDAARTAALLAERTEALAVLRRHTRMLELIPAAVIVRDLDGTIRWWNAGATELYGWPADEAVGRITHELLGTVFPPGTSPDELVDRLLTDGRWDGPLEHRTAGGTTVTVLSRWALHRPDGEAEAQVLEINADVTAARAAERALAESEQRFRGQFTNSAVGQIICDLDGRIVVANPAYGRLVGHPVEELLGHTDRGMVHPDDAAGREERLSELRTGRSDFYNVEGRLQHATGRWVDVEATVSLVREPDGTPKHILAAIVDISDRRTAERARDAAAEELAVRNDELEAANQLKYDIVGMLGHEIGNPLSSISGYAEVLVDDWDALGEVRRARSIEAIGRQAGRLDEIVKAILAMVTIDSGALTADRRELSVHEQVGEALAGHEHLAVEGPDAVVLADAGQLRQILLNLLSNADKYGGGVTAVRITTGDGRVRIHVVDGGPGVPEEFRGRLFERLSRAARDADAVRGTGLGLYIVRGLAHANRGDVVYEPNPGGGSVFIVSLEESA